MLHKAAPAIDDTENALLHAGSAPSAWGNLGLWAPGRPYADACAALAQAVGEAARLSPGDHVLSLGCGAGEELLHWINRFGADAVVGIEADPDAVRQAHALAQRSGHGTRITVLGQSALPHQTAFTPEAFDAVVAVDAAYHFSPRAAFLQSVRASLAPGGRLAFTDLSLPPNAAAARVLRLAARLCGLDGSQLATLAEQRARLQALGFVDVQVQLQDTAVLGGFATFAAEQRQRLGARAQGPGWRRVAATARLIGAGRALGLGYALWSARKPAEEATGSNDGAPS